MKRHKNMMKTAMLAGIALIQGTFCAMAIEPISFAPESGGSVEAISFENMECRVRGGVTRQDWVDGETMPGWMARAADQPATYFNYTHGSAPAAGIQVLIDPKRRKGVALGTFIDSKVQNAMLAVAFRNDSGETIDRIAVKLQQVQWMGGTVSHLDRSHGWWRVGDESSWNKKEELDLANFVANPRGGLAQPLFFDREAILEDMAWAPGETLWFRWVDKRIGGGGNAGAGIASLKISIPE